MYPKIKHSILVNDPSHHMKARRITYSPKQSIELEGTTMNLSIVDKKPRGRPKKQQNGSNKQK